MIFAGLVGCSGRCAPLDEVPVRGGTEVERDNVRGVLAAMAVDVVPQVCIDAIHTSAGSRGSSIGRFGVELWVGTRDGGSLAWGRFGD